MKTGDIVELRDGSYSMLLVEGEVKRTPCAIVFQSRCYRVLSLSGVYPIDDSSQTGREGINHMMLVDVKDPGFILFTQVRFCHVVTLAPKALPPDQLEIVVPRGTKGVHLILQ